MRSDWIADIRGFNRTVAERIGALNDRFLARDRPLGEARLLWEIGQEGCEVRTLRSRLDLDSGYTSRMLRSLEAAGMVTVAPSPADGRIRVAHLTSAGLAERAELDARSDELAASLLAPLHAEQRERLIDAMRTVQRLLTLAAVEIRECDPGHPDAEHCLLAYYAELDRRSDAGFDPAGSSIEPRELIPPAGCLLVARLHGAPVGCGAVRLPAGEPAHIRRMWVAPHARGLGLGRRLLHELEDRARAAGALVAHLETNRVLTEAIALYRSAGYREIGAFNDEPFAHHWFERRLTPA